MRSHTERSSDGCASSPPRPSPQDLRPQGRDLVGWARRASALAYYSARACRRWRARAALEQQPSASPSPATARAHALTPSPSGSPFCLASRRT
jgi:hypothetical protein